MSDDDYRQASLDIWDQMAAGWDDDRRWIWDASRPVGEWLVGALDPQPGETILELAAGVGDTGLAAASRLGDSGRLIATDFSEQMVAAASRRAEELGVSNVDFRRMDAERMDLDDDSIDGVVCRWGYMLMADPRAALRETGRVLRPGGRVALSVWGDPRANLWASVPAAVLSEHTGQPPPDPLAPGIFAMASEERTRELLTEAGLTPRRMEHVEMEWSFDTPDDHWRYVMDLAGALAMRVRSLPEDDQAAVRRLTEERLRPMVRTPGYGLGGVCLNVLAE
jgi:ubiquinone/menaquinone biosynthesis C-methylase UbiE